jgi:aspartyl-tRNA synthetase
MLAQIIVHQLKEGMDNHSTSHSTPSSHSGAAAAPIAPTGYGRTHHCGALNQSHAGQSVQLSGWVNKRRDHGGIIFIDIRDRHGITQLVIDPSVNAAAHKEGERLRNEFVFTAKGKVRLRPEGMRNEKIPTGAIEVIVTDLKILSEAKPTPFVIDDHGQGEVSENLRLKYRYLDLRRTNLQKNLVLRHKAIQAVRNYLSENDFLEIETPILYKSTPEGARDYIVPSRVNPGTFYALPQSPQTLKQLLMISGMDRYYQIARCFRDEDLRADRQPEFSQIDIEVSFLEREQFFPLLEGLMERVFKETLGVQIPRPFPRMSYDQAMADYGVDKPDTRFDLRLKDLSKTLEGCGFKVISQALAMGGMVKALAVAGEGEKFSRKDMDDYTKFVGNYGARGLLWFKFAADGSVTGPAVKFFSEAETAKLRDACGFNTSGSHILFMVADQPRVANDAMGNLRLRVADKLGLIDKTKFNFLWVTEFPLLEYSTDDNRWYACHHPFTSPVPEHTQMLLEGKDLGRIKAAAYDMVLNGVELGGGSLRIFNQSVQGAMFRALGLTEAEAREKFGFFLEALQYGTPPHGGIAFGVDRLIMLLAGTDAIREVMAFPKTQRAQCLMSESPSAVTPEQLAELHVGLVLPKAKE